MCATIRAAESPKDRFHPDAGRLAEKTEFVLAIAETPKHSSEKFESASPVI
jgi:hypothetical protein